jgi:uncharacterized protein
MWKQKLSDFMKSFQHPAWGISHSARVFDLSIKIAKSMNINVDQDILFAAAYIHDIGAFEPYKKKNIDHAITSIEHCEVILNNMEFPSDKLPLVKKIIKGHMFYAKPSEEFETILFHDADTLDFMGIIGITRILSIVGIDEWTPDLNSAIKLIKNFQNILSQKLLTDEARKIGKERQIEMENFLTTLANETNNFEFI